MRKLTSPQADCDDLPAVQAILQGAKDHYKMTGKAPILIHTVSQACRPLSQY